MPWPLQESRSTLHSLFEIADCKRYTYAAGCPKNRCFSRSRDEPGLEQGELLEFTLRSDIPVDVLLCDAGDYDSWVDSSYDPEIALGVHLEAEDVLAPTLRFTAPVAGEYAVLLMNWTECPADLAIEIPDWLATALR